MHLETRAGIVHFPSPKQAEEIAQGLGDADGDFIVLVDGEALVRAWRDGPGGYVLEYRDESADRYHQALSVSLDTVADAVARFAAGDASRTPHLRWGSVEARSLRAVLSGGERLPEDFYAIAPRLRRGDSLSDIRKDIMTATGLSRLAAAKRVEEVQKLLRAAKAAVFGGIGALGMVALFHESVWHWILFGIGGLAQLAFAWYIFGEARGTDRAT